MEREVSQELFFGIMIYFIINTIFTYLPCSRIYSTLAVYYYGSSGIDIFIGRVGKASEV